MRIAAIMCIVFLFPTAVFAKGEGSKIVNAFGLNIHAHQRIPVGSQEELLGIAADNGVNWAREEFIWEDIEPTDDEYDWAAYDAVVEKYEAENIRVLGLLTYSTTWSSSNPESADYEFYPPDMDAWKEYVGTAAARYAGRIDHWEIWNEANTEGFWKGTQKEYAQLLRIAANEIHAQNPNAKVVFGGTSGSDNTFLNSVFKELDDPSIVDIIAFHPYREINGDFAYGPERTAPGLNTLLADITKMKVVMHKHGHGNTPIWLTEIGWPTSSVGVSQKAQANYLLRMYTEALSVAGVRKVFWYTFVDDPEQFGLLKEDYTPKPSLAAYAFAAKHLRGQQFIKQQLPSATVLDDFSQQSENWRIGTGECSQASFVPTNKKIMKSFIDFTQEANCFALLERSIALPHNTRVLQFKLRGTNPNALLRMRVVDSTGETFQYDVGTIPNEWLQYTVQLSDNAASWGGNNDGKLDQPLRFESLVVNNRSNKDSSGYLRVDSLRSSTKGHTFLYTFKKGKKKTLALWRSKGKSSVLVRLAGKRKVRIKRFRKSNRIITGSDKYVLEAKTRLKYLRVIQ